MYQEPQSPIKISVSPPRIKDRKLQIKEIKYEVTKATGVKRLVHPLADKRNFVTCKVHASKLLDSVLKAKRKEKVTLPNRYRIHTQEA